MRERVAVASARPNAACAAAWLFRPESPLRAAGEASPHAPLAGLTFAVKDNIDVAGWPTTAGCPAFSRLATESAAVVQKLLAAGASLVGKTSLDQFACGLSGTRSPHGAVPNAFDSRYVSGGSSSGSAYVVASGQVDFALGTDTAGSGRVPAGLNNIVGLKPSRGLLSAHGVLPAAQSVDCVSIFARSVAVAAQVLASAIGFDARDPYSRVLALTTKPLGDMSGVFKFGLPTQLEFFGDAAAETAFSDAVKRLEKLGGVAVTLDFEAFDAVADLLYGSALVAERYAAIQPFFDSHETDVIEPVRSIVGAGRAFSAADVFVAQTQLRRLAQRAAAAWSGINVLAVPTAPTHYTIEQMQADPIGLNRRLGRYTNFVNLLDYAAIAVPSALRADGMPFGITLIGRCGSDWQLAELGQRYHHATYLTQGATGEHLPAPIRLADLSGAEPEPSIRLAVVGAHLSGMPLNAQLTERRAVLVTRTQTAPRYRLYALSGTVPPKPGLLHVDQQTNANADADEIEGASIAVEIWQMPLAEYGSFVSLIPAPLGIGTLELDDGDAVQGFICEAHATRGATDISHFGGWRAYLQSLSTAAAAGAPEAHSV